MTQTVVTYEFENYLQEKIEAGLPVTLNRFVLAYIPGLDVNEPVFRTEGLPDEEYIVHEQDVDQVGKVNENALAYSIVMDTTIGDFQFNAMYLIDNADRRVGVVVHKETEQKIKTDEAQAIQGNSIVKNIMMEYANAAESAYINVTAETWQIDFSARLQGMDDDDQARNTDDHYHDSFIKNGFLAKTTGVNNQYRVSPGVGYIGGLRIEITDAINVFTSAKPTFIYAIANRQGTVTSKAVNSVEVKVSTSELVDYSEGDTDYFVAKIAQVKADGSVLDLRKKSGVEEHELNSDPHPQYAKKNDTGSKLNQIIAMMRKMEGKVGRVRIYMADDIDDDYLPIVGQTITKAEYPDYFEHLGITDNALTLPDWTKHPYLHQASSDIAAGSTLEQQILKHAHEASSNSTGSHSHTINNKDLGTKNVSTTDLGTKTTNTTGNHAHGAPGVGFLVNQGGTRAWAPPGGSAIGYQDLTEYAGNHSHTVSLGSHYHSVNLGSHNHTMQTAGNHEHEITVEENGADLLRPNSTAVVFAVKVKYIVGELA